MIARREKLSPGRSASVGIPELPPARRRAPGGRPLGESTPHVEDLLADSHLDPPPLAPALRRYYRLDEQGSDGGYMPAPMCAVAMGISQEQLARMVGRGWLSCRAVGSSVWIRPASVRRI